MLGHPPLDLGDTRQRPVPPDLQLTGDEAVLRIGRVVLSEGAVGGVVRGLKIAGECVPGLVPSHGSLCFGRFRGLDRGGPHHGEQRRLDGVIDAQATEGDTGRLGSYGAGGFDGSSDRWTVGGIGVSATASNTSVSATDGAKSKAYLDSYSSGNPAGLSVCSTVSGTQCGTASDDNTGIAGDTNPLAGSPREILKLTFDTTVSITSLTFNNRDHDPLNNAVFGVNINGISGKAAFLLPGL